MVASIVIPGLSSDNAVPGVYISENFAAGPATGSGGPLDMVILANPLPSGGTGTKDTVIYGPTTPTPLQTEADMIALAGAGSPAHRIFRRLMNGPNTVTNVNWVFVTPSTGAAASGVITITGTATANGSIRVWVGDEFVDTAISSGDTPTVIGANVIANINAKTYWACSAANAAGVVTLTAKCPGPRGNWLRFQTLVTAGITTAATGTVDGFFTGGTTADSNTAALGTILPKRFYYIVSEAEDATQVGAVVAQVNNQSTPLIGITQRVFYASIDTIANVTTITTGINALRSETPWLEKCPWTPGEIAAYVASVVAMFEANTSSPRCNFSSFGADASTAAYWQIPRSRVDSAAPTYTSIKSALNNGISPIGVSNNGQTYLVNRITNRSMTGSTPDYRIRDSHKVTITDFFSDALKAKSLAQYNGKKLLADPPQGAPPPPADCVTPGNYKSCIFGLLNDFNDNALIENVSTIKAGTVVQRETNPTTRLTASIPLDCVEVLLQIGVVINQVGAFLLGVGAVAAGYAAFFS